MEELKTLYIDSEDLEEILGKLQDSFKFEFSDGEIENLITIDQLADKVISKLNIQSGSECTSQIVFNKLKNYLVEKLKIPEKEIQPNTRLQDLFPGKGRKQSWKTVFSDFYMKVPGLTPPPYFILTLIIAFIASVVIIFISSSAYGLILITLSWIGWKLAYRFGKSFPEEDLGKLANKLCTENYLDSRKHIQTINIPEIKRLIYDMIVNWQTDEDKKMISMNTKLDYTGIKTGN